MNARRISFKPVDGCYQLTYDGKILGDDRRYSTYEAARAASIEYVENARPNEDGSPSAFWMPGDR